MGLEGGVKNTLKEKVKANLMGYQQSESERQMEEEMKIKQQQQRIANVNAVSGASSSGQLIEMKCSILFIIGQSLIEQDRLGEAQMVFDNALVYATQLNDTSKQLMIHDQLRDITRIKEQSTNAIVLTS